MGFQAEERLEQHLFKRLTRIWHVRRFVSSWLILLVLLISGVVLQTRALSGFYQVTEPVPGGVFHEGIVGSFTNANPIYATGPVDGAVSTLVFSGLMRYDENNRLTGDLAEDISLDRTGTVYTVKLRSGLTWHDGRPLTAEDVVFTFRSIQNPDAKSPLLISWQGVRVRAADDRTVVFTLPNIYSAFPHSLTTGIVPKHHLESIDPVQLRSTLFNTIQPIGSGPFKLETIQVRGDTPEDREQHIGLLPNENYHLGAPKLQRYIVKAFRNEQRMITRFQNNELNAIAGVDTMPDNLDQLDITEHNIPLTGQTMVFFKTTQPPFNDVKVRQALVRAADTQEIISSLGYPVKPSRAPLLLSHVGYDERFEQLGTDQAAARELLDEAGWITAEDGIRRKGDETLSFRLYTQSTSEYNHVSRMLQEQWREVGVDVQVIQLQASDIQSTVSQHNYDALLYSISLGTDPDVFPFWHSSQAVPRSGSGLNFSEYKSTTADTALEAGRTREDETLRAVKYRPFLEAWRKDAPALALFQPRFLYVTKGPVHGFEPRSFNSATDRYSNVHNWMIREGKAPRLSQPATP
jgi:peptide/nickel transport system substrate-binding protein